MARQHRILAVDDNATNIAVMKEILARTYLLETAANGEEALAKAAVFKPDLVLLDIMMPGINGYEVCRKLRNDPTLCHIKIIMVSAKAMIQERLQGYEAGADDYLTKPFDTEELQAKVKVYLRLKTVEEVGQLKADVLALLGHETRTPLNGILPPAEVLMMDEPMDISERVSWAKMIYQSGTQLFTFFDKVMTLSALKSGRMPFNFELVNWVDLIREAQAQVAEREKEKQVTVALEITEVSPRTVDRDLMQKVIFILLDNAVRFSPPGGKVTVSLDQDSTHLILQVRNEGPGIDSEFLPYLFDDLTDTDIPHHTEGHGLSLAIAYQIVKEHGGEIQVSNPPGEETTFSVLLPISVPEEIGPEAVSGLASMANR